LYICIAPFGIVYDAFKFNETGKDNMVILVINTAVVKLEQSLQLLVFAKINVNYSGEILAYAMA
jgi:hypothetical protein